MTNNELLRKRNLTNSDLEAMYRGTTIDGFSLYGVLSTYTDPSGWHAVEFTFCHDGSESSLRERLFVGKVYYKKYTQDPYGLADKLWESNILGERNFPFK